MENPNKFIKSVLNRITEIIWWNRGLTKLDNPDYFQNYRSFIEEKLINIKGPYLEFILPPKGYDINTETFLKRLNFDERVIKAVIQVLFKGNNFHLYEHQAQAIKKIVNEKKDIILSVPTATGKTEAFLIPILDYCVKNSQKGLKALIIYPMKTLEVDQLNRFLKYLYELNNILEDRNSIKIGIWDGDTPNNVGNPDFAPNAIPSNSYYRGMVCPICTSKLRINSSGYLYCELHTSFTWVMVTRENISNYNVDILITNPESIDFLMISPYNERQRVIGSYSSHYPVKYIVFDEIHIWTGLSGAGIKLFIQRLRSFFSKTTPQLILLSATVKEPKELLKSFTTMKNFEAIEFQPFRENVTFSPNFERLKPCLFEDLMFTLCYFVMYITQSEKLESIILDRGNTFETLKMLNLISINEKNQIMIKNEDFCSFCKVNSISLLENPQEFKVYLSDLLENYVFREKWRDVIIQNMPEVVHLINYSSLTIKHPVKFIKVSQIAEYLHSLGVNPGIAEDIISMCINFGRVADLLTDRYHIFLKPRENLFWCENCLKLNEIEVCECGNLSKILKFCRTCHEIYTEDSLEDLRLDPENKKSYPHSTSSKKCVGCGKKLQLYDIGVPYTTFISFLISAACRKIPSQKILIFSDGRGSAERIGENILKNDYNLVAEQFFLRLLINSEGVMNTRDVFTEMRKILNENYYTIFKDESLDSTSEDIIKEYQRQNINPLANISNMFYSINNALVTINCIYQLKDNLDYILAHELLKAFTSNYRTLRFTKNKIIFTYNKKAGITLERIANRFKNKFDIEKNLIIGRLYEIFKLFIEYNVISEFNSEEIENLIQNRRYKSEEITDNHVSEIETYLDNEKKNLQKFFDNSNFNYRCKTGVFFRDFTYNDFDICLVKKVVFCKNCFISYPIANEDLYKCPICHSKNIILGSRIEEYELEKELRYKGLGYLKYATNWNFNMDHWASDTLAYSIESEGKKIQKISIAVHRAGLPYSLRGIFEEGFRKHPPSINAISSTPTLELGIDIGSLDMICLVGIPPLLTNYVQRAGRTGRTIGNPSYIFNIIRNLHAIDNYYFNDLKLYFKEFKQIFVPDPKDFDIIYASHIVIIACIYLARNPDPRNTYERLFRLPEYYLNIKSYYRQVILRFKFFITLVRTEKKKELEDLIRINYGEHALTIFNRVFIDDDDDLFLLRIVDRFFGKLQHFEADQNAVKSLTGFYRSLDWWLSTLGLLANYRGSSSQSVPIYIPKAKIGEKQFELKELDRAIRENFPGPKNQDGALFRVETSRYIVSDVHGTSQKLVKKPIKLCISPLCGGGFIPYMGDDKDCQMCGSEIKEFVVYGLNSIKVRPARRLGDHFSTTPFSVIYPELLKIKHETPCKFFNLNATIQYGNIKVVKSTIAYSKRYSTSIKPKLYFSEAFIENTDDNTEESFDPLSLDSNFDQIFKLDEIKADYYPIGLEYLTLGLKIVIKTEDLNSFIQDFYEERLKKSDDRPKESRNLLLIALYSIKHAFKKMVSIYTESDMSDFEISFNLADSEIQFYLTDNCEGGNGISLRIFDSIINDLQIYTILENGILNCDNCQSFCDSCLLIERTREFIVKNNLLDRNLLKLIYSGKSSPSPETRSMKDEQETYWKNLIAEGETKFVEFKSSLRWDVNQGKLNKNLEYVIAKTISAFLNTDGGKLFIGVEDDGKIYGIEKDLNTLSKKNKDGFLLKLDQVINNFLGKQFSQYLTINLSKLDNKTVCILEISKSGDPVFVKKGNQDEFYIRGAAGSQPLGMRESMDYIKLHWPNRI